MTGSIGDRFGYRIVGELGGGRTLIHVFEEHAGSRAGPWRPLAVVRGLRTGETVEVEHQISDEGLTGLCGEGIEEVDIVNPDILHPVNTISANTLVTLFDWFPEQFRSVPESERRSLRALVENNELSVAMSIGGATCIGRAHYDHAIETGRRILTEVSIEVTEADRTYAAGSPALACLIDLLLERRPEMPATYRQMQLHGLLADFVDTCEVPKA